MINRAERRKLDLESIRSSVLGSRLSALGSGQIFTSSRCRLKLETKLPARVSVNYRYGVGECSGWVGSFPSSRGASRDWASGSLRGRFTISSINVTNSGRTVTRRPRPNYK